MRLAIEFLLMGAGAVLLGVYFASTAARTVEAQRLVDRFEARPSADAAHSRGANRGPLNLPAPPDQSDWSEARKDAYRSAGERSDDILGVLRIGKLNLEAPILAGTSEDVLAAGVGWLDRLARPGDTGNAAIAGHRDSFFRRLGQLERGDRIAVETAADAVEFIVTGTSVVAPSDVSVLQSTGDLSELTLITCYPFYFAGPAPKRYIVHAVRADRAQSERPTTEHRSPEHGALAVP